MQADVPAIGYEQTGLFHFHPEGRPKPWIEFTNKIVSLHVGSLSLGNN